MLWYICGIVFQEDTQTTKQSFNEEGAQKLSNLDKGTSYNHSFTGVIANKDRLPVVNKLSFTLSGDSTSQTVHYTI